MLEDYLTLTQAAKKIPGNPHASALWRWARKGCKVSGQTERLRLPHARIGSRIFVRIEDLEKFFADLANADVQHFGEVPLTKPITPLRARPGDRSPEEREAAAKAAQDRILNRS